MRFSFLEPVTGAKTRHALAQTCQTTNRRLGIDRFVSTNTIEVEAPYCTDMARAIRLRERAPA